MSPTNNVNVFQGDIRKIPFEDKYFSVTHSSGVMEDYSDDEIVKETGYHYKTFFKRFIDICKKPKRIFKPIALYVLF